jgi:hypothetical protein
MDIKLIQFTDQQLGYGVLRDDDLLMTDTDYNTVSASYVDLVAFHLAFTASTLPTNWGSIPSNTVTETTPIPAFDTGSAQ